MSRLSVGAAMFATYMLPLCQKRKLSRPQVRASSIAACGHLGREGMTLLPKEQLDDAAG